jgi:exodeoxyribonuclease VII large subunit
MAEEKKIYTLSDLGRSIKTIIEKTYTSAYWIKAEIAKLNYYPHSGHCYPDLVEKNNNIIQAQMRSTIWAADFQKINKRFKEVAGQPLKEGMVILFKANLVFHPLHGLSLQIRDIEPSFTVGEMALEKIRNIEKLKKEGVFDHNRKNIMPLLPARVAVISVETSKGYHDFLQILQTQASGFRWWHYLFPSLLQGDHAAESIIAQLRIIRKATGRFDMVAIIRGGGGDIGLNCYDNYNLAHEIATFPLPVITGIGHATNVTISEMVAWGNKITPTDVAYFIVDRFKSFQKRIDLASNSISRKASHSLVYNKQTINHLENKIYQYPAFILSGKRRSLETFVSAMASSTRGIQQKQKDRLTETSSIITSKVNQLLLYNRQNIEQLRGHLVRIPSLLSVKRHNQEAVIAGIASATRSVQQKQNEKINGKILKLSVFTPAITSAAMRDVNNIHTQLNSLTRAALLRHNSRLANLDHSLLLLNPINVLHRGYSITRFNGKALRDHSEVDKGDRIHTTLFNGEIESTVE